MLLFSIVTNSDVVLISSFRRSPSAYTLSLLSHDSLSLSLSLSLSPTLLLSLSLSLSLSRDKAPGQRECDSSIDNINQCIRDIEQASLAAVSQNLPCRDDISLEVREAPPESLSVSFESNILPPPSLSYSSPIPCISFCLSRPFCIALSLSPSLSLHLALSVFIRICFLPNVSGIIIPSILG